MSLIRQMALLLAAVVAVAMGGSVVMVSWTARDALQAQCLVRDGDAATMLASVMSHLQGDKARMAATLTGQFEAGRYRRIRLSGADGEVLFDREELADLGSAPSWLVSALPITIPLVQARVAGQEAGTQDVEGGTLVARVDPRCAARALAPGQQDAR